MFNDMDCEIKFTISGGYISLIMVFFVLFAAISIILTFDPQDTRDFISQNVVTHVQVPGTALMIPSLFFIPHLDLLLGIDLIMQLTLKLVTYMVL